MKTKEGLLKILSENKGADVSGQLLAEKLGVSRNAVWKAVEALRREGYEICSATNRGYRLEAETDALSSRELLYALGREDIEVCVLKTVDSTNNEAKRRLAAGFHGALLIVSEEQSSGRGRLGRSFYSPVGTGLYMSLAFQNGEELQDAVTVTSAAAVAVCRAITEHCGRECGIKWVNDIYIDGKKVCGMLTEAMTGFDGGCGQSIIVGIGVNCTTELFPPELAARAGSVGKVNRNRLAADITKYLLEYAQDLKSRRWIEEYRRLSVVLGREISYIKNGVSHRAKAVDIDRDGGLIVKEKDEVITLNTGEITVRYAE